MGPGAIQHESVKAEEISMWHYCVLPGGTSKWKPGRKLKELLEKHQTVTGGEALRILRDRMLIVATPEHTMPMFGLTMIDSGGDMPALRPRRQPADHYEGSL
jgi:hypothetical protein